MDEMLFINNPEDRKGLSDLDWVKQLYFFLQGNCPDGVRVSDPPKLSPDQAFSVIWFLQEHMRIMPATIEQCDRCRVLFDYEEEGMYDELNFYCGSYYNELRKSEFKALNQ